MKPRVLLEYPASAAKRAAIYRRNDRIALLPIQLFHSAEMPLVMSAGYEFGKRVLLKARNRTGIKPETVFELLGEMFRKHHIAYSYRRSDRF